MKILIISQIYLPEMGALANRLYPIVRQLTAAGHEVFVATGMPNYPAGKVFPEYRGKLFKREKQDGYTILRTAYLTVQRNKSKFTQLLSYLSFIPAVFWSGLRAGKVDAVFITSPPPFPVIPAILLAKLRGAKLVLDVRDLWSDELVTYAGIKESSIPIRVIRAIERWGYRTAEIITSTTNSLAETVIERGGDREKTFLYPNGADLELFRPLPPDNPIADSYDFGGRFVVMYAGLLGIKHGLESFLEAAKILRAHKNIVFFLLGNGAMREKLLKYAEENSLNNVVFGGERPVKDVPYILARADVCFAGKKYSPYSDKVISVKMFEYMACEKPVVAAASGECSKVVTESGGGMVTAPGNAQAIAEAVLELYKNPGRCKKMGRDGRRFVEQNYSRSAWAEKLEGRMVNLLAQNSVDAEKQGIKSEISAAP